MRRHAFRLVLIPLVLAIGSPALAQDGAEDGATVRVGVVSANTRVSIPEATVTITSMAQDGTQFIDLTDGRGEIVFTGVPGGFYRVDILPPGFAQESFTLVVPSSGEMHREFPLALARELPTIDVEAERIIPALARSGFYRRRDFGMGRFLTYEQIRATSPTRTADILARIPNVNVQRSGAGIRVYNLGATDVRGGGLCLFNVFLDGNNIVTHEGFFDGDIVAVDNVIGVEVFYRGMHAPQMYRGLGCGTILIWTGMPDRE